MSHRQALSPEQHDWLACHVNAWREASIINQEQANQILAQYGTATDRREHRRSWLMYTLSALVAVLFGAATLLLISYNWAALPATAKLLVIFTAIVAS